MAGLALLASGSGLLGFGCDDATPSSKADAGKEHDAGHPDASDTTEATVRPETPEWLPLPAAESYADRSLEQWAVAWTQWFFAQEGCESASTDEDGSKCGLFQDPDSPVFFFAPGSPGTTRTQCTVPAGKAILVPLTSFVVDNAGVPEDMWLSESELKDLAQSVMATMGDFVLSIDGSSASDLDAYAVGPSFFSYTLPAAPNIYTCNQMPPVVGKVEPSCLAGYFVMLPPPSPGPHELLFGGVQTESGRRSRAFRSMTSFNVED